MVTELSIESFAYSMWAGVIAYILNNRFHGFKPLFVTTAYTLNLTIYEYGFCIGSIDHRCSSYIGLPIWSPIADRLMGHLRVPMASFVWTSFLSAVVALLWFWGF